MDYLQSVVFKLVKMGELTVRGKNGCIELALLLEEAVEKEMLPHEVLETISILTDK